jgi:hypothetical protein
MNRIAKPKLHDWAYPYGDVAHDPWPGDLALVFGGYHVYRFDGRYWKVVR